MQLEPEFVPVPSADSWQVSNPPILAMAPLQASFALFEEAGMPALRAKSVRLTGYLHRLLAARLGAAVTVTPDREEARGCQLSLRLRDGARDLPGKLRAAGVVCDFREPDTIRVAPAPLYNRFHDAWRFTSILAGALPA
jgi:kynureninase